MIGHLLISIIFLACNINEKGSGTDITDTILINRSADCTDYADSYSSFVTDIQNSTEFTGAFDVSESGDKCTFTSNSIPNHDFNASPAQFATNVAEVDASYEVSSSPEVSSSTALGLDYDNAIFLNGVKLDLLAAACYGVGSGPLGEEKIGCNDSSSPWRYDPMYSGNDFGTDSHNAHSQPDGGYHYHGSPVALFSDDSTTESPVIGFAADGFPIYGPYIDDGEGIRKVVSGYTLIAGDRVSQDGEGAFPGGSYDGTYRDDYEFSDAGDLDECNGMEHNGDYGYYVIDSFPWVMGCFSGSPDTSFQKAGPS